MRFLISMLLMGLAITGVVASPHHHQHAHHAWGQHQAWKAQHKTDSNKLMTLTFAVPRMNTHLIESTFAAVSDPKNPAYTAYLTHDQVETLTLNEESMKHVESVLRQHGAKHVHRHSSFIKAQLTVAQAESLLQADVQTYKSSGHKHHIHRAMKYTLPESLKGHVEFVSPITHFPKPHALTMKPRAPSDNGNVDPPTLKKVYNIQSNNVTHPAATQGCFEDGQGFDPADIAAFQTTYNLQQTQVQVQGNNTNGCALNPNGCIEAELDLEYIMAVAQGAQTTYWAIDPNDQSPFLDWLIDLAQDANAPLVNSVSYGEVEQQVDPTVRTRFESEAQLLGTRGISVLISSGDDGVANFPARTDPNQCGFFPSYPASSPFVTAVGATQGPEAGQAEIAESSSTGGLITTGGGFSTVWARASTAAWQSSVVSAYLAKAQLPPSGQFVATGRGYPDVSLLGHNYIITTGGQQAIVSGTSASAPVFAALITLINSQRFAAGKKQLGFLNPALYQIYAQDPTIFNDITSGENNCPAAQSSPQCCQYGFYAAAGWDPLTGLGSPNFAKLSAALVALP